MTGPAADRRTLRLGSRGSRLALCQSRQVAAEIEAGRPGVKVEIQVIRTTGDRQQSWESTPAALGASGGKGIFVKEIEEAMLERRIDAAVHSMKDLPTEIPDGLGVVAVPRREDPSDVLVTGASRPFESLPEGARIGTGSPRRISQLRHHRPGLTYVPIRGNVDTRLRKVSDGDLDGVILASAGLNRLGIRDVGAVPLPFEICLPAPGQGALAIEARLEDRWVVDTLRSLHDEGTAIRVRAERAFLEELGGGCLVPAASLAELHEDLLRLRAVVADPEGERLVAVEVQGSAAEPVRLGKEAARKAAAEGASEILEALRGGGGA